MPSTPRLPPDALAEDGYCLWGSYPIRPSITAYAGMTTAMSFGKMGPFVLNSACSRFPRIQERKIARMVRRRWYECHLRLLPVALLLGVLAACGGTQTQEETITPQERLAEAAARIAQVTSLDFTLTHEEGVTPLFTGIVLQQAEGTVEGPDRATVDVEALATFANSFIALSIVIEGDDATMSDPLSGNPAPIATSELPFKLHNIGNTLSGILTAIQGPTYTSDETLDGVASKGISGSIAGAAIQSLIRRADADLRQEIEVWVGEDDLPRKVRITGKVLPNDEDQVIRVLSLRNFDSARIP